MGTIDGILETWMAETQRIVIDNYRVKGLKASGKFEKEIWHKTENNVSRLWSPDHSWYMINGRGKNQNQTPEGLKKWVGWAGSTFLNQWVKDKGLEDTVSPYAVAWKIAKEGIKVPNQNNDGKLLTDAVTPERIADLKKQIGYNYIVEIKSEIQKAWQQ